MNRLFKKGNDYPTRSDTIRDCHSEALGAEQRVLKNLLLAIKSRSFVAALLRMTINLCELNGRKKVFQSIRSMENARSESGVAMITVVIISAVLMVIGGGMYYVAARENTMSQADFVGGQAFYYAEGGIENVIDILNYEATEAQLTELRPDQSPDGYGYLMDPDPALRQDPTDPVQMMIGRENFTVWVDEVDQDGDHCTGCGLDVTSGEPAYLLITAEGFSSDGYRKLQQRVKVQGGGMYPLALYVDGDATINGNVTITNQSLFVKGNLYGREKLAISGPDLVFGGNAGVFATGSIYAKSNGGNSQIYTASGGQSSYWDANYINDRDIRGPAGNTYSLAELENTFNTGGLTASQLAILKNQAQASGYYQSASGNVMIQQNDLPSRDGDIVVYVEYQSGDPEDNLVSLKFEWPHDPYTTGNAIVIVKNGSVSMEGQAIGNLRGMVYCPDGSVRADGGGSGNFTGFVWGKGLENIGNFPFNMTQDFLDFPPYPSWTVVRETAWTEVDR